MPSNRSTMSQQFVLSVQLFTAIGTLCFVYRFMDSSKLKFEDVETVERRLAQTLQYLCVSLVPVVISLWTVAISRYFTSAIDPLAGNDHVILLQQRIFMNNFEQFVIHAFTMLAYSTFLDADTFKYIPFHCILFFVGRIIFTVTYYINSMTRVFGVCLTLYPTIFILAKCVWKLFDSGRFDWILEL